MFHITPSFSTTHSAATSPGVVPQHPPMSRLCAPVPQPACTPACVVAPGLPCPPPVFVPQLISLSSLRHMDMPSQHQGYIRRQPVQCRAGARRSGPWTRAHILVDSGSQQPPLISMEFHAGHYGGQISHWRCAGWWCSTAHLRCWGFTITVRLREMETR